MALHNYAARSPKKVFDKFSSDDDYGFTKIVAPVTLIRFLDGNLIFPRSQAKRLLARFDRFKIVVLDFFGVMSIGHSGAECRLNGLDLQPLENAWHGMPNPL
jgi:hypothetical protein